MITTREGNTLYYECAIPWSEIPDVKKPLIKAIKLNSLPESMMMAPGLLVWK
ncbi:hypothetical protein SFC43_21365 [Bacteroides sp. CR5/BHMF/2]|nr:hypothetical protein [Bacteroides sp. CR5/BHMF/2]